MSVEGTQQAPAALNGAAPVEPQQSIDPKFAQLAKKEKWIRDMQKQVEADKSALQKERDDYKTNYVPKDTLKSPETAIRTLLDNGITYDQITQHFLNSPDEANPLTQITRQLQNEIKSLREELDQTKKIQESATTENYQQALKQIEREVVDLVDTDPEFATVKASGKQKAVVKLIEEYFTETGDVLSVKEAAAKVEEWALEDAVKLASVDKVKQKLAPIIEPPKPIEKKPNEVRIQTLTNSMSSGTKPMTARERAILAFQGKLQK